MTNLRELYNEHEGKFSDKWSLYLEEYDRILAPFQLQSISLLEIGVQNGGSLEIWAKYFPQAKRIVGCDINEDCGKLRYVDPRISLVIGNAVQESSKSEVLGICESFDIVIDDGSHKSSDIIKSFSAYFGAIKPGGLFIAEDLHCSYWQELEGGLYDPYSSISFFKYLADIINQEHWGVEKCRRSYLKLFEDKYGIDLDESELKKIHSVEFVNSLCIIKKNEECRNILGPRVLAGDQYLVYQDIRNLCAKHSEAPSQIHNRMSNREKDPVLEIEDKKSEIKEKTIIIEDLIKENESLLKLKNMLEQKSEDLEKYEKEAAILAQDIKQIHESTSWRITSPLRWFSNQIKFLRQVGFRARLKQVFFKIISFVLLIALNEVKRNQKLKRFLLKVADRLGVRSRLISFYRKLHFPALDDSGRLCSQVSSNYPLWSSCFDTPSDDDNDYLIKSMDPSKKVLVIAGFDKSNVGHSLALSKSLIGTIGQAWEAVFLFSSDVDEERWRTELLDAVGNDPRFLFELPPQVLSEPLVLIEAGVEVRPHALRIFYDRLSISNQNKIVYCDEDFKTEGGNISEPWFKPEYSTLLAKQGCLFGRVVGVRIDENAHNSLLSDLTESIFRLDQFALDYAGIVGRDNIEHIPHVLFHNLLQRGSASGIEPPALEVLPNVAIIIPTRDRWDLLGPCLRSIEDSDWPESKLDIFIVDNGSEDKKTLEMLGILQSRGKISVIRDDEPFNWSRLNNLAAARSSADLLIFLNNDTEVDDSKWIRKLAAYAMQDNVGAVGCKLLFPDRTVQHGGVIAGIQGVAGHGHLFIEEHDGGYCDLANLTREVSAITGACLAVEKRKFDLVGGFNESFPVAFNDVVFCFDMLGAGLDNIYLADALLIHHESKSRGYDDTPEKISRNRKAAMLAWSIHPKVMRADPFYSANLSLFSPYMLSEAPRRKPFWYSGKAEKSKKKVMLLSSTHAIGHGVPAVLKLQADFLVHSGFEVIVAGPLSQNDFSYDGCERLEVHDSLEAVAQAALRGVDVMIPHTPPFFSVSRWTGNYPVVICYDHGEPPADWFPDSDYRKELLAEKDMGLTMSTYVYAISNAIAEESRTKIDGVIPEGNTHLGKWDDKTSIRREAVRKERGWEGKFVVLDVCRFHSGERLYKGVNTYASVYRRLVDNHSDLVDKVEFVLCGKGNPEDVQEMERQGLTVFANVTNEEMFDLYAAADAYMNFSKWEGFNLGIAQALAMGLPALASDIPAHRAFDIPVTGDELEACDWLIKQRISSDPREPKLMPWEESLKMWAKLIVQASP